MENVLKLLVFALLLVCRRNCGAIELLEVTTILTRVSGDMDQRFFAQVPGNQSNLQIWHSDSKKLVVTSDNPLQKLTILQAPTLDTLVAHPNTHLEQLILRYCPLDGLGNSLFNLQALRILKLTMCQFNGSFNLAELLTFRSLTTFSLEANRVKEVVLQLDESAEETKPAFGLEILDLNTNAIEHFNLDVLRAFPKLKKLLLQRNVLITVSGSTLLMALEILDVTNNFLTKLDLSGCNCSSLRNVYAASNKMSTFPAFGDSITGIQVLNLNNNQLAAFNMKELKKLQVLTTLSISVNALKSFNDDDGNETAMELPSLVFLELDDNQIESLDLRGWQVPSLKTLRVMNNPLVTIPDDLLDQYPQLTGIGCLCPNIDCQWVQRNVEHIRSGRIEMSVARQGPMQVGKDYRCVTVPYVGCVRCPFKRNESEMTKLVH